jgi:hypothetical protein
MPGHRSPSSRFTADAAAVAVAGAVEAAAGVTDAEAVADAVAAADVVVDAAAADAACHGVVASHGAECRVGLILLMGCARKGWRALTGLANFIRKQSESDGEIVPAMVHGISRWR